MDAKVNPRFWSDADVEKLSPEQKLALLWMITSPQTSLAGVCQVSLRRFELETGVSGATVDGLCKAMSRSLLRSGNDVFIKNFIRYQFGEGDSLVNNNIFSSIMADIKSLPSELKQLLADEYPEIKAELKFSSGAKAIALRKPLPSPKSDLPPAPEEILKAIDPSALGRTAKKPLVSSESASPDAVISELQASGAYPNVDLRIQFARMVNWCRAHRKMPTKRRFVAWLNRIDSFPANGSHSGNGFVSEKEKLTMKKTRLDSLMGVYPDDRTDEQRKEISNLRSEINDLVEKLSQ